MPGSRYALYSVCMLTLAVPAIPAVVSAQTLDDTGLWFAAFGNGAFDDENGDPGPFRWWFDAHYRLRDDAGGFNQSILRPGLGVEVAENQVLWAGYAWIRTSPILGGDFDEHRFWQQWTATPSVGDYRFLHRSRFEQRWFESSDDVALRWRQMFGVQRLLSTSPQWSAIAWDEAFFHLNDTDRGISSGFDQNRAFLGAGYQDCPHAPIRTEIGYLNQLVNLQGGED